MPAPTVVTLCNSLNKSGLLPPNDVKALFQRWRAEAKTDAENPEKCSVRVSSIRSVRTL